MKIIEVQDYAELSQRTMDVVKEKLLAKPEMVLSVTTGATPKGFFKLFVEEINAGLDISKMTIFNLDEYVVDPQSPQSVRTFMYENFYNLIKQQPANIFMLDGGAEDEIAESARYRALLAKHPRDIQILGLGVNGHVGANEPGVALDSTVFCAPLAESTIQSSIGFFAAKDRSEVPQKMFTLGLTEIMAAEQVILFASGASKADAIKRLVEGEVSCDCPASILQKHENALLIADKAALSKLKA